jgi:hypothetical protein
MAEYIDTRDLQEELDALVARRDDVQRSEPLTGEDQERLTALEELAGNVGDEFRYGATMIPERDFEDYARELAEDIGAISGDEKWPATCIDWKRATWELSMDYSMVTWEGIDYYVR